jgi:hypothetical protein
MAVHHEAYPVLEVGRTVCQDRVVAGRADLVAAVTCVRALERGFMFRLSIIADHELEPARSFGFERRKVEGALDLWLTETDAAGAETVSDVHLQGGGGGGSRYDFDFWVPVREKSEQAAVVVSWVAEGIAPTAVPFDLAAIRLAGTETPRIAGPAVTYP